MQGEAMIGGGKCSVGDPQFVEWISTQRPALPEFRRAAASMCVRAELMAESRTARAVEFLTAECRTSSRPAFSDVALSAVSKALPENAGDARHVSLEVPGLASGRPYEAATNVHNSLQRWQQDLLCLALDYLCSHGTTDDVIMSLGLLMRGARECQSRKTWAFYAILTRCVPSAPEVTVESGGLAAARSRLMAAAREFLDDEKDAALLTYFVEPSWMYLRAVGDGNPDVVVHGANTYIAALAATLGVRFSREPYLQDESKGVTPFLRFKFERGALEALQRPENFGKSWEAVRECKDPKLQSGASKTAHEWIARGGSPLSNAQLAIGSARTAAQPYMEAFASAFSPARFLPRLFSRFAQVDALAAALSEELKAFHAEGFRADAEDDGSEEDCRFFLWDLEAQPEPSFRLSRAIILFSRVGIVKPALAPELIKASDVEGPSELVQVDRSQSVALLRSVTNNLLSEEERETTLIES